MSDPSADLPKPPAIEAPTNVSESEGFRKRLADIDAEHARVIDLALKKFNGIQNDAWPIVKTLKGLPVEETRERDWLKEAHTGSYVLPDGTIIKAAVVEEFEKYGQNPDQKSLRSIVLRIPDKDDPANSQITMEVYDHRWIGIGDNTVNERLNFDAYPDDPRDPLDVARRSLDVIKTGTLQPAPNTPPTQPAPTV